MRTVLLFLFVFSTLDMAAQADPEVTPYGFLDVHYSLNVFNPNATALNYHTNYREAGQTSVNFGTAGFSYQSGMMRGNLGLMAGTYTRNNFNPGVGLVNSPEPSTEPEGFNHVFLAWGGLNITENVWIDAGIFESFVGNESVRGLGNATLTRSLAAELTPYYLSGVRAVWNQPEKNKTETFYLLNGWQRMAVREDRPDPGFGFNRVQQYKSGHVFVFNLMAVRQNSGPMVGGKALGSFHNLLLIDVNGVYKLSDKTEIRPLVNIFLTTATSALSSGLEKPEFTASIQALHHLSTAWTFAARLETAWGLNRQGAWSIDAGTGANRSVSGGSAGLLYKASEQGLFRLEARYLYSSAFGAFDERNPLSLSAGMQLGF